MEEEDFSDEELQENGERIVQEFKHWLTDRLFKTPVTTETLVHLVGEVYFLMRLVHPYEEAAYNVSVQLALIETWLQEGEGTVAVSRSDDDEPVLVPIMTAEQGGLQAITETADAMRDLQPSDFVD